MRRFTKILLLFLLITTVYNCKEGSETTLENNAQIKTIEKTYGIVFPEKDSISVNLNLADYKTYDELLKRLEQIGCKDRIPKITLKSGNELKKVYFHLACIERLENTPIKQKNLIEIHNDTIFILRKKHLPLDSLKSYLKENITNYGKNPDLSESPDKLRIFLSYEPNANPIKLEKALLKITEAFDDVGGKNILNIRLNDFLPTPPPPPPPPSINSKPPPPPTPIKIEIIEDENEIEETIIESTEYIETVDDRLDPRDFDKHLKEIGCKDKLCHYIELRKMFLALPSSKKDSYFYNTFNDNCGGLDSPILQWVMKNPRFEKETYEDKMYILESALTFSFGRETNKSYFHDDYLSYATDKKIRPLGKYAKAFKEYCIKEGMGKGFN